MSMTFWFVTTYHGYFCFDSEEKAKEFTKKADEILGEGNTQIEKRTPPNVHIRQYYLDSFPFEEVENAVKTLSVMARKTMCKVFEDGEFFNEYETEKEAAEEVKTRIREEVLNRIEEDGMVFQAFDTQQAFLKASKNVEKIIDFYEAEKKKWRIEREKTEEEQRTFTIIVPDKARNSMKAQGCTQQ